jgi:transcription initiation factor TFIID subunit 1
LHATQGKAMLKLYGDGDPSSRGEAFSFLRVSMKDIFIRAGETESERMAMQMMEEEKSGHKYNVARQQEVYKGEVQRIWNAQRRALENAVPPKLTQEEQDAAAAADAEAAAAASGARNKSLQHARSQSRADSLRRDASPSGSQDGTPTNDDTESMADSGKVLRIRRFKMGRWVTEIVRETAVIHAYIRQRQRIEDERTATEALLPTGDAALDALRRKRLEDEIRSSLKNRDRRLQRKNAKALAEGLPIEGGPQALLNKTNTKRQCGRCGQVGHMSTNTSCPMFNAAQKDKSAEMALHGMSAGVGGTGAGAVPGALSGPGHRPSMMGHQSSWFGASPNPSVPQSPMTPMAGGPQAGGYMTPGTPGAAQSPPASAPSPATANAPSTGKIKLKIKR